VNDREITRTSERQHATVAGSPFAAGGSGTNALALPPDGAHLIAANGDSRNLTVFQVAASTGALTSLGVQPTNTLGTSGIVTGVAFAPAEAGFLYALQMVQSGPNQIHQFRINPSTGALTPLAGFPIDSGGTGGGGPCYQHLAYVNGRLYVLNIGSNTLTAFKVNRTTGALTALPFSPIALGSGFWTCVIVHPSGSPVVVANLEALASYAVSATTAAAAPGSPFANASGRFCRFSQDGAYLYTGGANGRYVAGFSVNAATGVLAALAGSPFDSNGNNPFGYATDRDGRLFLVNFYDAQVRAFTTSAGVPSGASGNPFASGLTEAAYGVLHPSGFYMAADRAGNRVGVYQIGGSGAATTLTAVGGSPFASSGSSTSILTVTEDGVFLVGANGDSRNLTVYRINPATGELTRLATQPANTLGATGYVSGLIFVPVLPPFIDDPLTAATSVIKAVHITELRTRIDAVRTQYGLGPYAYTDPTLTAGASIIRAVHISELRTALGAVYTALGMPPPSYTDPTLTSGETVVKVAHIAELRAAVLAIE